MSKTLSLLLLSFLALVNCSPSEGRSSGEGKVAQSYLRLLREPSAWNQLQASLSSKWSQSQLPMVIEIQRFNRSPALRENLYNFLSEHTQQNFGDDRNKWQNWMWQQDYEPDPGYPAFKSLLYQNLDPRFADYFDNDYEATIRLDEVVWGGVGQDGIPPLRQPRMLAASKARYLDDSDIVFGIEIDGEARAYPKRILAWHEMFIDTIKGIPLAGVY